jgi:phospho-N-acetylmuramoyl-pentapeptide-transferase
MIIADIVKVTLPAVIAFIVGIAITPVVSDFLYRKELWKKKSVSVALDGRGAPISQSLHNDEAKKTPRMGGSIIWISAAFATVVVWFISKFLPTDLSLKLDFLSRNQTWLPLFTLVIGGLLGLIDDYLETRGGGDHIAGGLSLSKRLALVSLIGLAVGSWFYFKLDVSTLGLPGGFTLPLGMLFIPFFIVVVNAIYSGGVIDGIDGLSGGIFATIFSAYAGIAFYQQQINLAAFCLAVVGGILAFLWFNIPPARFYMSETGIMGLTITLAVVAFMTDSLGGGYGILVLPVIAMPLVITTLSDIIQISSKRLRNGKKIFLVAPIHHHFQAIGWPSYKVTMRFWIIGVVFAILGVILALVG